MKDRLFVTRILVMALVFGMTVLVIGCGQKGGTVTFINDEPRSNYTVNVGIAVSAGGTPNAPIQRNVERGQEISVSLDEDGYYAVSGTKTWSGSTAIPIIISRSGRLTGGETVTIKSSEF